MHIKKSISTSLLILSMVATLASPQNAQAIVGLAIANPALAIAGGVIAGASGLAEVVILESPTTSEGDGIVKALELVMLVPAGLVGLVILDGSSGQTVAYKAIDNAEATKLGLSAEEVSSYNANLKEINMVLQSVESDLSKMDKPTIEDSRAAWANYDSSLPAPALRAVSKVSAQAIAK